MYAMSKSSLIYICF